MAPAMGKTLCIIALVTLCAFIGADARRCYVCHDCESVTDEHIKTCERTTTVAPTTTVTTPAPADPTTPAAPTNAPGDENPPAGEGGDNNPPAGGEGGDSNPPAGGEGGDSNPPAGGEGGDNNPPAGGEGGDSNPPAGGEGGDSNPPAGGEGGDSNPPAGGEGGGAGTPVNSKTAFRGRRSVLNIRADPEPQCLKAVTTVNETESTVWDCYFPPATAVPENVERCRDAVGAEANITACTICAEDLCNASARTTGTVALIIASLFTALRFYSA